MAFTFSFKHKRGGFGLASALLFGLIPTDPVSLLFAALLMLVVAMVAGYLPSRRATRVDPIIALKFGKGSG